MVVLNLAKDCGTSGYEGASSIVTMTNDSLAICGSAYRSSQFGFLGCKIKPDGTLIGVSIWWQ